MAGVMIGIDPHKGSHTAFAFDEPLPNPGRLRSLVGLRLGDVAWGLVQGGVPLVQVGGFAGVL